jgi:hypothetical protein
MGGGGASLCIRNHIFVVSTTPQPQLTITSSNSHCRFFSTFNDNHRCRRTPHRRECTVGGGGASLCIRNHNLVISTTPLLTIASSSFIFATDDDHHCRRTLHRQESSASPIERHCLATSTPDWKRASEPQP